MSGCGPERTAASGQRRRIARRKAPEPCAGGCCGGGTAIMPLSAPAGHPHAPALMARGARWRMGLAAAAALGAEVTHWAASPEWLSALLALVAVALVGLRVFRKGLVALCHADLNINALMTTAVIGAFLLRQWPEAAAVLVLFELAERIEARSLDRARNAIRGLMDLSPEMASVRQADGGWVDVPAAEVPVGSIIRVLPGGRIPLDGTVSSGSSAVDQSPITGESLPVDKGPGDPVYAGTVNQAGLLEFQVNALASRTTLARIIHAIEEAQARRAPIQRFVDRFARVYTPLVFAFALAVAVIPPLVAGGGWSIWTYRGLVLLVIACPCALVISTPITLVSGLTAAARKGILIKGGLHLEQGAGLAWLAFDKTGTLTHGRPVLVDLEWLPGARGHEGIAVSLAARSDHPVSRAIAASGRSEGPPAPDVAEFTALPGRGLRGSVGGVTYHLGSHRLIHDAGLCSPELEARILRHEELGRTVVLLADPLRALGLFAVADTLREESREAIAELHALGIRTAMLTGDNHTTARAIAGQVGIDEVRAELLPEDKLRAIESFSRHGRVGMVGDGINDAPALARADIGFAMGAAGSDTAMETADVALMDDGLGKLAQFVHLSRETRRILRQNITLALVIKGSFLALTLAGLGTMWMAVFADMGASLLVIANSLRILKR